MSLFSKKNSSTQNAGAANTGADTHFDDIMKKYDKESNTRIWDGTPKIVIQFIMAAFSLYCIWSTLFSTAATEVRITMFLGMLIIMGYLSYPARKKHVRANTMPFYDIIIMVLGSASFFYYSFNYTMIVKTISSASKLSGDYFHIIIGVIAVLALAELCRRCVGIPILCVVGALLIYTFSTGLGVRKVVYTMFYTTNGILSTPIQVCAKYIVVFIIFGAFLERTGISNFFISLANSLVGWASGGPAKVAVISSALCGMVSGSSVGNTVTTGSITIPMMKKTGYKPEFAGAVEAAASTGGQIMPPIMGAAAFLMAEYLNVSYSFVVSRAIIPAILYFTGIFIAVHLEAKKLGLKGTPRDQLPKVGSLIKQSYLLLPLVILIYLVTTNTRSLQFSAVVAIVAAIAVSLFDKENRITFPKLLEALEAGGRGAISVAVACGIAGMVAGCINVTGLASKLITAIVNLSGDTIIIALVLTMICCIILGMGVPTTANYCIMASTCAPILIQLGLPSIVAHFFVFYFGIVADITPPVALAAFAGAAIAKGNPIKTGFTATRLAIAAFIVPYIFAFSPQMMLIDTNALQVAQIVVTALIGIFGVAAGLGGYMRDHLQWPLRILSVAGGLCLIDPGTYTDLIGIGCIGAVLLIQIFVSKRKGNSANVIA